MLSFFKKKTPEEEKAEQIVEFRMEKEVTEKQIKELERKLGIINKFLEENDK